MVKAILGPDSQSVKELSAVQARCRYDVSHSVLTKEPIEIGPS
jgi:hypothetical protein